MDVHGLGGGLELLDRHLQLVRGVSSLDDLHEVDLLLYEWLGWLEGDGGGLP